MTFNNVAIETKKVKYIHIWTPVIHGTIWGVNKICMGTLVTQRELLGAVKRLITFQMA
ncbi:hypothetical protein VCRA2119O147_340016 [Vibrio crassostreae]|nr:hypothetical protein VCRA2119O147_340016 [Vibrio crassostreae]CAK2810261.1 hypothetical protein VCRA2110O183_310016 [Vibrio crassostreae]CAK2894386.1 hypothetical protein VCRA2121O264_310016 [Vibrio crassostreae]